MRDRERAALERLTGFVGAQFVTELVSLYLDDLPGRVARARDAGRAGDAEALAKAAHAIRASSAQLGADKLAAACDDVELSAERGDLAVAAARLDDLVAEAQSFTAWLSEYVGAAPVRDVAAPASESRVHDGDRRRIAVVEDNADNRLLIDAFLGDSYALDEYATGADALSAMMTRRPDLVLLDVSLPGMDGLDVLARMRDEPALRNVPVVAVTAHAMKGDRERYLAIGFDGYVPKPIVDERELIDVVERLINEREASAAGRPAGGGPA